MFKKILLPLDGSDLAEEVIPYGEELAAKLGSEVILFHVCDESHQLAHSMHRHYLARMAELTQERLSKTLTESATAKASAVQLFGDFHQNINDYCTANDVSLVIMVAHGFTSLKVMLMGSIVDKVFRLLNCPCLLVQTGDARRKGARKELFKRILLPLDGSEHSEIAIPAVRELGLKLETEVVLFTMAKMSHMLTSKDDIIGEAGLSDELANAAEVKRCRSYLKGIARKLAENGLNVSTRIIPGDDRGSAITSVCQEVTADLVVMATQGRQPITAWAPGSIAHKLLSKGDLPLMIVS